MACGADGAWFCASCREAVFLRHHAHERVSPFASVLSCGSYADPRLRRALTTFKYRSARCVLYDLSVWLKLFRQKYAEAWPWAGLSSLTVTSIPGDARRLRERGMDHASLLADKVKEVLVPWAERRTLLARKRHAFANANLPATDVRAANMKDVFVSIERVRSPVLLVDDIFTTGATATEAARILIAAGSPAVHLFTFARG